MPRIMTPEERPVKLLCDEMLGGLGRWLRAAGHDTVFAGGGLADSAVLDLALADGRLLLTCDRALAAHRAGDGSVVVLPAGGLEATAGRLAARVAIDWLYAPFSRCLIDNAPLRTADAAERARMPAKARLLGGRATACPACGRVYWPGSHLRRMRARLERWQALHGRAAEIGGTGAGP